MNNITSSVAGPIAFILIVVFGSAVSAQAPQLDPVSIITGSRDPKTIFGGSNSRGEETESSESWFEHDRMAREAFKKRDLPEAERLWNQAIDEAEKSNALQPGVVSCLCGLSLLNHEKGSYAESERLYELAMRTVEGLSGRTSVSFARMLPDLAWLYNEHGKPDKAEDILKQALSIHRESDGEFSIPHAQSLEHYAAFLEKNQRRSEAAIHRNRAQQIRSHLDVVR